MGGRVPLAPLADLPTPAERLTAFEQELGLASLHIKRDDLSGAAYGGNKVRKLEFLLGRARRDGCRAVMTFGGAGSNHALATAIYARRLGMDAISMLVPQPASDAVRHNLLMGFKAGAELHLYPDKRRLKAGVAAVTYRRRRRDGRPPMNIPAGGSSTTGALGFVNAALELAEQVAEGLLPPPDVVYVAAGTLGTCAGLALGLRAAHIETAIMAVRVTEPDLANEAKARALFQETNALLHGLDPAFPVLKFPAQHFTLRHDFFGEGYGVSTPADAEAVRLLHETAGVLLDHTYTGKAFAALIADARAGRLRDKNVLFWNTYNSRDLTQATAETDYHDLPTEFHPYFERDG
ncbi:MAG TPA: pyridoxal-phosphate dependent enzyme [Candidatus Hydrogenedentes bacterium]|nr:pyridoxal-phosphate dependent enzyme [Candidatus Hydrogenedentota bacterium]HNT88041.1 pyridoxal-phosphate dependent enzyme [Candidatus Hydrogenedentota bacterium]